MKKCSGEFYDRHAFMEHKADTGEFPTKTGFILAAIFGAYLCAELSWAEIVKYFGF